MEEEYYLFVVTVDGERQGIDEIFLYPSKLIPEGLSGLKDIVISSIYSIEEVETDYWESSRAVFGEYSEKYKFRIDDCDYYMILVIDPERKINLKYLTADETKNFRWSLARTLKMVDLQGYKISRLVTIGLYDE